ncbi:MAG TPA: ABC transporter permease [Polyangia bacterium]|nr:ABC transporter permease [Polyangia bacterium]
MRLVDQFRSVRHTFDANRGRTLLTLIGIMIGAGSIVLLASLLSGGQEALLNADQGAADTDIVQVDADEAPAKQVQKTRRELGRYDSQVLAGSPTLPGVQVATEKTRWWTKASFHKRKKRVSLVGAAPVALSLYRLDIDKGRFISADDLHEGKRIAVIGLNVWNELLGPEAQLGDAITVDNVQWTVVGVLKNKPPLGGGGDGPWMWNNKVLVPQSTFDAVFDNAHTVDEIFVKIGDGVAPLQSRLELARKAIEATLLRTHYGVSNFKIDRWGEEAKQETMILEVIKILLLGTGLLSLFVGGINIMNIMLVTVTERTREIGVRRAIGANPTSILTQFLLESAAIALVGGIIGVLGGLGLSTAIAALLTKMLGAWKLHVEAWSIALGLGLSVSTGVVFGIFPAWRAAKLDPVEALRYE